MNTNLLFRWSRDYRMDILCTQVDVAPTLLPVSLTEASEGPLVGLPSPVTRFGNAPANFKGILQADAFSGYGPLYQSGEIIEAACMAHARRKFHDLHVEHVSPITTEALRRIGELYVIEGEICGKLPNVRRAVRQEQAKLLLEAMHDWLHESLGKLSAKSETTKKIRYMLERWHALTRYVDDGRIEIDNNIAERALRTVALGRKKLAALRLRYRRRTCGGHV